MLASCFVLRSSDPSMKPLTPMMQHKAPTVAQQASETVNPNARTSCSTLSCRSRRCPSRRVRRRGTGSTCPLPRAGRSFQDSITEIITAIAMIIMVIVIAIINYSNTTSNDNRKIMYILSFILSKTYVLSSGGLKVPLG